MQVATLLVSAAAVLVSGTGVLAQDETGPEKLSVTSDKGWFFNDTIDFWKNGNSRSETEAGSQELPKSYRESIWAEPIRMPDGRYAIYVPPRAVLEFLEDPTPARLKAYLAWKKERSEKLRKALALLGEHRRQVLKHAQEGKAADTVPLLSLSANRRSTSQAQRGVAGRAPYLTPTGQAAPSPSSLNLTYYHQHG